MDAIVDVVSAGGTALPIKKDNSAPVDLLGRQVIVDRIMKILEVISKRKSSCTFTLNGAWGTGKTFVLNMLMNQLWECHSNTYIVIHYNCWQYDYYEEPLIAIVAAMLDSVDEENHLLSENIRNKAKAGMELAKPILKRIATDFVKNKIGVDLTEVVSSVTDYQEALDTEEQKKAESRSFDEFYSFKKAICKAQDEIRTLTKDRTLVVVVDELDRCLPSYAIKVLERFHHLFEGIENTAILLAVDKSQLDTSIRQIFGDKTDASKYLRKFINFELELNVGNLHRASKFMVKFQDYVDLFDNSIIQTTFPYEDFIDTIFDGIDIRTVERLVARLKMIHTMYFGQHKVDYSIMCCELLMIVLLDYHKSGGVSFIFDGFGNCRLENNEQNANLAHINNFLNNYWTDEYTTFSHRWDETKHKHILEGDCVIQKLLFYYANGLKAEYPYTEPDDFSAVHPRFNTFHRMVKTNADSLKSEFRLLMQIK